MNNTHKTRLISWGTSIGIHTAFFLIVASTGIFAMVNRQPTEDLTAVIYDASGAAADDTAADSNQATDSVEPELAALEDISIPEAEVPPIEPKSTDTSTKELQKQNVEQNPATGKAENNNATGVNNSTGQSTGTSSGTASTGQADPNSPVPAEIGRASCRERV